MTAGSGSARTVVLDPAAETQRRRLSEQVPGCEEAWRDLMDAICANPRKGWRSSGGRRACALVNRGKPTVRVHYTFDEAGIRVIDIRATPVEYLPPDRGLSA